MQNRFITLILVLLACTTLQATTRKVLFIGNSYTYFNNMPAIFQSFALAKGDTVIFDMSAPGGYTFQQHSVDATTAAKITAQQWDIVVLQEQSQMPAFPPAQVATDVYPYAHILDSLIHHNDTCTQTMFLMTWGHQNGDPGNCAGYPVICSYEGMQARLRESYLQMMQDNQGVMAPVGAAWKVVHDSFPTIGLWIADSSHPQVAGSYLEACVLYDAVFHKRSLGGTYLSGLSAADAQTLQRIADKVTIDSMSQWIQYGHYPYATYNHTQPVANTISFTNHSTSATHYTWSFGDAGTDTAASPVHTYLSPGIYTVTLTAGNDCFTETRKDTIHVGITTGIGTTTTATPPISILQNGNGSITLVFPAGQLYDQLEIYDSRGRVVSRQAIGATSITSTLPPGLYLCIAYSADHQLVWKSKVAL